MKKFVMYGAGNIGRGFIGQLFSGAGYSVGFVDINKEVIGRLNQDKEYPVDVVSNSGMEEIIVKNAYGIDGTDIELVSEEIACADIMATAIGVNVLKFIAKPIALGLKKRFERGAKPFNIIICENLIGADQFLKGLIKEQLPEYADKIDSEIGFVEASIGRMVPVLPEEKKQGNPLRVYVEPYNILPVDKDAFKGEIPDMEKLYPFAPFNLFIQRKLFMHNMSHATCAYLGYLRDYEYIYEAIADFDIKYVAYRALTQSALAVSKENGVEIDSLLAHAENLLYRFTNKALADTVARVGKDTKRKLSSNDRLIGAINLCDKHNLSCEYLCIGVAAGMAFDPEGDDSSKEICAFAKENGAKDTLKKYCNYDGRMADLIATLYGMIQNGKQISALVKYVDELSGKTMRV
ncbi:MAG: mannitol dehydrogenase [Clostridiales bacterium]|nr:mannitol dehydrogenase [Clostridiales bacterium]